MWVKDTLERWMIYQSDDLYYCFTGENSISIRWLVVSRLNSWSAGKSLVPDYDTIIKSDRLWFDSVEECNETWKRICGCPEVFMMLRSL